MQDEETEINILKMIKVAFIWILLKIKRNGMNGICQRNGTKNLPKLNEVPFKCLLRKYGTEKKIHTKAKYMKFQNPGIKGTLKSSRKKNKTKTDDIQRIQNQNNIRLVTNGTEARSEFWEKFIFNLEFYIKTIKCVNV